MKGKHNLFAGKAFAPLVLPAVYDDVLSYEEWLSKVIYRINELQEYIDETMENIEEIINRSVEQKVAPIREDITRINGRLNTIDKEIEQLDKDIKNSLKNAKAYTDNKLSKVQKEYNKQISDLAELVETYHTELLVADKELKQALTDAYQKADLFILKEAKRYCHYVIGVNNNKIFARLEELNARIDELVKEYPELYDPATGENEHMQTLVYNMYRALRTFGIRAMLYDDQLIEAEKFDGMGLSAQEYDTAFAAYIWDYFKTMFNPFTGKQESTREVLQYLINNLRWNAKTTSEYDGYEFTSTEFDKSDYGAYQQDNSKYYTTPDKDTKNKAYKNWLLLAQDNNGVEYVAFEVRNISEISILYGNNGMFTIPLETGTYTAPNTNTVQVVVEDTTATLTFTGSPNAVYGVTYIKDISALDN